MESAEAGPSYTVLRIKRKATDSPLSSLIIQGAADPRRGIKKRLVSSRHRGVFRLAETVPGTWEGKGEEGEVLKERIKVLLAGQKDNTSPSSTPPAPVPVPQPTPDVSQDGLMPAPSQTLPVEPPQPPVPKTHYRVVPPPSPRTRAMLPPRVLTYAETEGAASPLVFVDAQAVPSSSAPALAVKATKEEEEDMANFLPMLQEYLRLGGPGGTKDPIVAAPTVEEEYVYDLYYRDIRAESTALSLGAGDGVMPVAVGALLGFEDFSPPSTPSDSEPEDEADEDSNEEDYYRNDYPEDEDADEDMREFEDAYSDGEWSRSEGEEGSEGGGGGTWDYR